MEIGLIQSGKFNVTTRDEEGSLCISPILFDKSDFPQNCYRSNRAVDSCRTYITYTFAVPSVVGNIDI